MLFMVKDDDLDDRGDFIYDYQRQSDISMLQEKEISKKK